MSEFNVFVRNRHFQRNQSGISQANRKIQTPTHTHIYLNQNAILFIITRQSVYIMKPYEEEKILESLNLGTIESTIEYL